MDDNRFFREVTLRICGDLQIEKALCECLQYMCRVMPLDIMFLEYYDHEYRAMRTIARATQTEGVKLDLITPLSLEAQKSAQISNLPGNSDVFIFGEPLKYAISREMLQFHGITCSDLMVLQLKSAEQMIGALVLISETQKYTLRDARLVQLLKEPFIVATANVIEHREVLRLKDLLADDNRFLHGELRRLSGDEIVGANFGLKEVMYKVQQVAALDSPVLLMGETGVGKDVIANLIHYSSTRSEGPFVSVNCGAIPDTLIDSELFGHEKGAFTGALFQKRGRFERADGGTIFLDEIGELPLKAQVRLLKVLQSKEIERVGGVKTLSLNIRVIAASNRDLELMVRDQQFREDLWFRLNVFPIHIPPLRERRVDIPALLQHFITSKSRELKLPGIPRLAAGAIDALLAYEWPGNVRELQNVVERALILNPGGPLTFDMLHPSQPSHRQVEPMIVEPEIDPLNDVIARHIRQALEQAGGKVNGPLGAATLLGLNPSTLRNRMRKLGIKFGR